MGTLEEREMENVHLRDKIKELDQELERKDEMHLHDLTLMRDQLQAIMNKHCLN